MNCYTLLFKKLNLKSDFDLILVTNFKLYQKYLLIQEEK
jgi:hypothetical protein